MSETSAGKPPTCRWCGNYEHKGVCPLVKSIEYQQDGVTIKRIEFHAPAAPVSLFDQVFGAR